MMENLPQYVSILFIITTLVTVIWFYLASKSKIFLGGVSIWIALQTYLSVSGFYQDFSGIPPKVLLSFPPTLIVIIAVFMTKKGRTFIQGINLRTITYMSAIRIPVEIVLTILFHHGVISIWQTLEGSNFDILSGITAPLFAYMVFDKKSWSKKILIIWNIICLLLLLNVVVTSILATPFPLQQISFDQPNIAIAYFPFVLLPSVVVPIVIFSHLVSIVRLRKEGI